MKTLRVFPFLFLLLCLWVNVAMAKFYVPLSDSLTTQELIQKYNSRCEYLPKLMISPHYRYEENYLFHNGPKDSLLKIYHSINSTEDLASRVCIDENNKIDCLMVSTKFPIHSDFDLALITADLLFLLNEYQDADKIDNLVIACRESIQSQQEKVIWSENNQRYYEIIPSMVSPTGASFHGAANGRKIAGYTIVLQAYIE